MAKIIQFPGLDIDTAKFTPDALRRFQEIPKYIMKQMIESVFCPACGIGTTIIVKSGRMLGTDLILTGKCRKCWGEVERLISANDEKFRLTN